MECMSKKYFNAAASRLYYSVFQVIYVWAQRTGQVDQEGKERDIHSRVLLIVDEYCRKHPLTIKFQSRDLKKLRNLRRTADYERDLLNRDDVVPLEGAAEGIRNFFKKEVENVSRQ